MPTVRQDMVKRAVAFLRHPKVKDAPLDKQVAFLKDKSLTNEEISEALTQAAAAKTSMPAARTTSTKRLRQGPRRSEAVVAGGMVFISGQTAFSPEPTESDEKPERLAGGGEEANGGDRGSAEVQTTKALERVKVMLEEAGSSVSKVVAVTFYVKDASQDLAGIDAAWGRWIEKGNIPARTIVQIGGIIGGKPGEEGDLRVEVQATAHL